MNLRMSYSPQGKKSANCGPCSIKMILDYYGVRKPSGESFNIPSLNRLLKTSRLWGTEYKSIHHLGRRLGLKPKKVQRHQISRYLQNKTPLLTCFIDEEGEGHYAILKGQTKETFIFHDPYFGKNIHREKKTFIKMGRGLQNWTLALTPD